MTKDKKCLLAISVLMQIVFVFFDLFFSIFIYDLSQNLNIIISYTILKSVLFFLISIGIYKKINENVLRIMYKVSFVMSIISIALTFTITTNRIYMIFVTQCFLQLTSICYYMPHEVATMSNNRKSQMRKFMGLSSALNLIGGVLSPFLSGLIIDYSSYYILFSILIVIALICFGLSFGVDIIKIDCERYGLIKFVKDVHKSKKSRLGYLSYMFHKLSIDGVVALFLPLLIFMRTGTNFSVGIYSALANLIAGTLLLIYCYFSKDKKIADWLCTIFQIIASISIIIWNSILVFFVYYFIKNITTKILSNDTNSSVFSLLHHSQLKDYHVEQFYTYNFYHHGAIIISGIIGLIVYNIANNVIAITALLAVFSLMQIFSTIFLHKSDNLHEGITPSNQEINTQSNN